MSMILKDEPFANRLYEQIWEAEKQTASFPDKEPTTIEQAAYNFLITTLENTEEKEEPYYPEFLIVSYYRQVIEKLSSPEAWKESVEDGCRELTPQFDQASSLLAPYIQKMEEHIKYGVIDKYELYQIEVDSNRFNSTPVRILNTTYHPELEDDYQWGRVSEIVDAGYLANRFNMPKSFATLAEAQEHLREYYLS